MDDAIYQINSIKLQNNLITNKMEILEILADSFANISSDIGYSSDFLVYKSEMESNPLNIPEDQNNYYNSPFTLEELNNALNESKGSSPGPDDIHYDMLKSLSISCKLHLLTIYNNIFLNHKFPAAWRKSYLVPILKKGKDPKYPDNYRPISLTNCLCKVLEKMISKRLLWFLEHNNLLSIFQSGFRKNRSTLDNLAYLESEIMEAFANRKYLISLFFDNSKAYDRTWRRLVLTSMLKMGLKGHIVHFVKNFFKNRTFQVLIGNSKSSPRVLQNGLLQGSVISVTLFILTINDIFQNIHPSIRTMMYCDDLCISLNGNAIPDMQLTLQNTLNALHLW
jgi:hypothetical protein